MPKKDVTLKTKLTRDEVVELLSVYQIMDDICDDFQEMFDFRPRTGEDGNPNHWQNYVMPDDDRAWYHVPKDE